MACPGTSCGWPRANRLPPIAAHPARAADPQSAGRPEPARQRAGERRLPAAGALRTAARRRSADSRQREGRGPTPQVQTPAGPCWHRYNEDGYGEHYDGSAYDGTGRGRAWPLLTGERGHYELCAGRDPLPFLEAMARMASPGGMLPEQVWDAAPIPARGLAPGRPTGAAMPLVWAHAEYLKLAASRGLRRPFDQPTAVWERYGGERPLLTRLIWTEQAPSRALRRAARSASRCARRPPSAGGLMAGRTCANKRPARTPSACICSRSTHPGCARDARSISPFVTRFSGPARTFTSSSRRAPVRAEGARVPFTLAHPAAVLPLRSARYLRTAPLIIGAIAPDVPYFLPGSFGRFMPDTHESEGS